MSLAQQPGPPQQGRIKANVDLVVLHASVLDARGHVVTDLPRDAFRIYENKVAQELSVFRREDVPVTVGLVIDNSGSMKDKRERVNAAALTFVKTSNPQDEAFVVNFNDDYYLDLDKDFTSDIDELREALERIDARGSTALYDAVIGSLDHLKKGRKDKKVLLVITDGEDTASRGGPKQALQRAMLEAQKSEAVIYTVGLLGTEKKAEARRAREALRQLSGATGGMAFFPETLEDVEPICAQIAQDIRSQYTLAYYPTNPARDGSFRAVQVTVNTPRGRSGKYTVRHRTGYFAPKDTASMGNH
jgi:VWFA-related protein